MPTAAVAQIGTEAYAGIVLTTKLHLIIRSLDGWLTITNSFADQPAF